MTRDDLIEQHARDIIALVQGGIVPLPPIDPPIGSPYVRPLPIPRSDYMAIPINFTAERYVSSEGHDSNSGTLASPWLSIDKAFTEANRMDGKTFIRFKHGEEFHALNGFRFGSRNNVDLDKPLLIGTYGEGAKPILNMANGIMAEGGETNPVQGRYFQGFKLRGVGNSSSGFFMWDDVKHIVWDDVEVEQYRIGLNVSIGRQDDGLLNSHFAILNCEQHHNPSGGIYTEGSDIYVDKNNAHHNGNGQGARNYYFAGMEGLTKNITLQNSQSYVNCPKPEGGAGPSPCLTAHGWIDGLNVIDNEIIEIENTSSNGTWGAAIDEGRSSSWGEEKFIDAVITGNKIDYTGNLNLSLTSAPDALVGWNEMRLNSNMQATGIAAPGKTPQPSDYQMKTGRFVHNKIYVPEMGTAMRLNMENPIAEYNEIIKLHPDAKGIMVNGEEYVGNNVYSEDF